MLLAGAALPAPATAAAVDTWRVDRPTNAVRATDGSILVTGYNHRVLRLKPDGSTEVVAGTGLDPDTHLFAGDGGPATEASLRNPLDVAALADGGVLVADAGNHRIRRVFPDGHIDTVAGGGHDGPGCAATRVTLGETWAVSPTPDGGFVLSDTYHVRRVWPDGSLTTIPLDVDLTQIRDVAPLPDGGYLVAADNGVWHVDPNGSSRQVAGHSQGASGYSGDGGPATEALLHNPASVAPLSGGGFLISDQYNHAIRRVDAAGKISTYLSGGLKYPWGISADPDDAGSLIVANWFDDTVQTFGGSLDPPNFAPMSGGYQGTGGYQGACQAFDPSFDGGSFALDAGGAPRAMIVQPDGKAVFSGDSRPDGGGSKLFLLRVGTDGKRDPSFGTDGMVQRDSGDGFNPYGLVRQSTGRLVVAGREDVPQGRVRDMLVGFTADGVLDPTFGDDGEIVFPSSGQPPLASVALAPDNRIVLLDGNRILRFLADGRPDPSFGDDGIVEGGGEVVTVQPDGRIVIAGGTQLAVVRFEPDGSLDHSFNGTGVTALPAELTPWFRATAVTLAPDGDILAGGFDPYKGECVVIRLDSRGRFDSTFGDDGVATYRADPGAAVPVLELGAIEARDDGRIVLAGGHQGSHSGQTILVLNADGSLDHRFGTNGKVISEIGVTGAFFAVASLPGGKLLAGGYGLFGEYVAARYRLPDLPSREPRPAAPEGPAAPAVAPPPAAPAARASTPARAQMRLRVTGPRRIGARRLRRSGLRIRVWTAHAGRLTLSLSGPRGRLADRRVTVRRGSTTLRLRARRVVAPKSGRVASVLVRARLSVAGRRAEAAATRVLLTRR